MSQSDELRSRDAGREVKPLFGKADVARHAGAKARIILKESRHSILITSENHDQIFALIFHGLQQHLNRFLTVVAFVLWPVEIIGLVDEEHAAHISAKSLG